MFTESAQYYDVIYSFKDYQAEVQHLVAIINRHHLSEVKSLLDVACGTGKHIQYLKDHYEVEGLDLSQELLDIAGQCNPGISYHPADMVEFDLGRAFDVVTCLFSSIGYVKTHENLIRALTCMTRHLLPGGILIIEPWFTPDTWNPGTVHAHFIDEPDLKIARVNTSSTKGRLSCFDFHYLIGTPEWTKHFIESHELGLFTTEEMSAALVDLGLTVTLDAEGLTGRGLFIGRKPV